MGGGKTPVKSKSYNLKTSQNLFKIISKISLICLILIGNTVYAKNYKYIQPEYIDNENDGYTIERAIDIVKYDHNKQDANINDKKIFKEIEARLNEYYDYFSNRFDFKIDGWKKLSYSEKVDYLLSYLTNIKEKLKKELYKENFGDETVKNYSLEKIQDDFAEKVANIEGKTEDLIITDDYRENIPVTKTTWIDENGKEYTKEVFHGNDGDIINLKESNIPLYDYESIELKKRDDGSEYYIAFSKSFTTDGQQEKSEFSSSLGVTIPNGYKVAKDRSEGKNGKLIIVPEDKSLLPDGAEVKSDGRGGWILTAPESAYKENGNLNLKPDPTLEKTIEFYDDYREFHHDKVSSQTSITEYQTQKNGRTYFGRSMPISDGNDIYYKYTTINDKNKGLDNFETIGGKVIDGIVIDKNTYYTTDDGELITSEEMQKEMRNNKKEILNKISGYGK